MMPPNAATSWTEHFRRTLERYDEPLLRRVAAQLIKPRNQWPAEELIERCVAATTNAALIDRRLDALDPACRRLLAFVGHSRQPRWRLDSLLELLAAVGHAEGPRPVFTLFEAGLLYPDLPEGNARLKSFEQWLGQASATSFAVIAHPLAAARSVGVDLGLPVPAHEVGTASPPSPQEADGLDWPLRLAALWQQVADAPLRRTQQGDFFKRDFERLRDNPLLNALAGLTELPDGGLLAVSLGRSLGVLQERDGELRAANSPAVAAGGIPEAVEALWTALLNADGWDPVEGWRWEPAPGSPYASAYLLALLLLARLDEGVFADPTAVEGWVREHHPYWSAGPSRGAARPIGVATFLLGPAYELRLVQAARLPDGGWRVRLSRLGRWLLGVGERPGPGPEVPQTLLVQPNLEIIAYRQGLTPELIGRLAQVAAWKSLGPACTLQLEPHTVYRALESGLSFEQMVQLLERHGTRALPASVLESLRTWANKRDRITVFPAAVLLEFASADDLNEALARGLPALRVTDRLAAVANEGDIDYRHFRLTGTRDYTLPPEKCIDVADDGVTLTVDPAKADLLLECELPRFAEPVEQSPGAGPRRYRLTPASLSAARAGGFDLAALETWFQQRTGQAITPAARLLMSAAETPEPELKRYLVLEVATEAAADGLLQWPATRALIEARLGPTALVVSEANAPRLRQQLEVLGMRVGRNRLD